MPEIPHPPTWWPKLWQRLFRQGPRSGIICHGSGDWSPLSRDGYQVVTAESAPEEADGLIAFDPDLPPTRQLKPGGTFLIGTPFVQDVARWKQQLEDAFSATIHVIDPEANCPWLFAFGRKAERFEVRRSVLMVTHQNALAMFGGGETQLFETLLHLRDLGIRADVSLSLRLPTEPYDLAHVFSLYHAEKLDRLRGLALPIVTSTIFWDYSELRYASAITAAIFSGPDERTVQESLEAWRAGTLNVEGLTPEQAAESPQLRRVQRGVLDLSRILLPNGEREAHMLQQAFGPLPAPVQVVPNAVYPERFLHASPEAFIQQFGLQDFVLCAARLEPNKNQSMLLWALRDAGLPIVLAGPAPDAAYLAQCERWAGPDIHYVGELSPDLLASAYAAARVHALPSWSETPGLANLEAGLTGCALVVGNRGTEAEYLGDHAFICDPGDWHSIRQAVLQAWEDTSPERREARRQHIRLHYSWERTARITADCYEQALRPSARASAPVRGLWEGGQFVYHSLAYVNRELELALLDTGEVELSLLPIGKPQFDESADPRFGRLQQRFGRALLGPADFHLRHQFPPNFEPPPEGHWIMIQPWEFGGIPEAWRHPMHHAVDEIWVPSRFVRDCYLQSGIAPDRVHVVPNGVDTRLFSPQGPQAILPIRKSFKFLYVGGTILRKGLDILLTAYLDAFTAEDDVCLVIKDFCTDSVYAESNMLETIRESQERPNAPKILYLNEDLPGEELAALYRACDALVHPYRGEGFGLPIAEAMACGLPVIVPNYGACLDFCDSETAILVPAEIVPLRELKDIPPTRAGYWVSEVQNEDLIKAMRSAWQTPERGREIGRKASERIRREFTWPRAAEVALERLRCLQKKPIVRHQADYADPRLFHPDVEPFALEGLKGFNFLTYPDWERLDWVADLRAYLDAFSAEEDVSLVLRIDPNGRISSELAQAKLIEALSELGRDPEDIPDLLVVDAPLPDGGEAALFTACQAFITRPGARHNRKAEACGLALLEAPGAEQLKEALTRWIRPSIATTR